MFQCDINDAPVIGILGIVSHRAKVAAKDMYSVFDLNRSQASILLTLHHCESMSQKDLAKQLNITAPSITSSIRKMEQFDILQDRQILRIRELCGWRLQRKDVRAFNL